MKQRIQNNDLIISTEEQQEISLDLCLNLSVSKCSNHIQSSFLLPQNIMSFQIKNKNEINCENLTCYEEEYPFYFLS